MTTQRRFAYYPGCSLLSSAKEYDISVRATFPLLDVELVELEDWSCCGAVHADVEHADTAVTLPARNLALAKAALSEAEKIEAEQRADLEAPAKAQ